MQMKTTRIGQMFDVLLPEHRANWDIWGGWELKRFASMAANIHKGDILFDVGAEQGDISAAYAQMCGGENIVLFEPDPFVWPNIRLTWEANGLQTPRGCYAGLVGDRVDDRPAHLNFDPVLKGGWPGCAWTDKVQVPVSFRYLTRNEENTPQITLDEYVARTGIQPDVLTIDVEGAEVKVLPGATDILTRIRPMVYVSIHPDLIERDFAMTDTPIHELMASLGYSSHHLNTDHEQHWVFFDPARRPLVHV